MEASNMATVTTDGDKKYAKSFILRPESWNVFAFAETYICFQLEKLSGARVYIQKHSERDQETKREIKAEGTTAQLNQLGKSLRKIESKSLRCSKHGHLSIVGNLSIFFEGSQGDEDYVKFGEYDDICQTVHENRDKFIPYLSQPNSTSTRTDLYAFQSKFLSQWQKVRNEYDPLFHGDLCLVLTYGYSYFMNLSDKVLSVRHLNEHLEGFHDKFEEFLSKIGKGKQISPVPYWHSFIANSGHFNGFKEFLNSAFDEIRSEKKMKVRINKLGMCELDKNFCFHQLNVPKIEWFDGRIIRKTESACPKHKLSVTCKLISYRDVHLRDLQRAEEFRTIIKHDGTAKICGKEVKKLSSTMKR